MASKSPAHAAKRPARRPRGGPGRVPAGRRFTRAGRRTLGALRGLPLALRVLVGAVAILVVWAVGNWGYQVLRKPTELFFPVSGALAKRPPETWWTYGPLFTAHATAVVPPELLAALAQAESGGDPVARTFWRWRPTWNPLDVYRLYYGTYYGTLPYTARCGSVFLRCPASPAWMPQTRSTT